MEREPINSDMVVINEYNVIEVNKRIVKDILSLAPFKMISDVSGVVLAKVGETTYAATSEIWDKISLKESVLHDS